MATSMDAAWLTTKQAAELLGVSPGSVRQALCRCLAKESAGRLLWHGPTLYTLLRGEPGALEKVLA